MQNDIVKEYLSRGTYIFPPEPSKRLIVDMVAWCAQHAPKWNPMNVCSYHLQEAGATPTQELAYSLATTLGGLGVGGDRIDEMARKCTDGDARTVGNFVKLGKTDVAAILRLAA